jgi:hypothetical protein
MGKKERIIQDLNTFVRQQQGDIDNGARKKDLPYKSTNLKNRNNHSDPTTIGNLYYNFIDKF